MAADGHGRHPVHVEWLREQTAAAFLAAQPHALSQGTASAMLSAAAVSDEHNGHCRAGTPISPAVQQARRELHDAMAALLTTQVSEVAQRAQLTTASHRLSALIAEPAQRVPGPLIFGKVCEWLGPEDSDAMRFALKDKRLRPEAVERVERRVALAQARGCERSVLQAASDAWKAHEHQPTDRAIEQRLHDCLKNAQDPLELIFDTAHATFLAAKGRARADAKEALLDAEWKLRHIAGLRLAYLTPLCRDLQSASDARLAGSEPIAALEDAMEDLRHTRTLLGMCKHALTM